MFNIIVLVGIIVAAFNIFWNGFMLGSIDEQSNASNRPFYEVWEDEVNDGYTPWFVRGMMRGFYFLVSIASIFSRLRSRLERD